MALAKFLKETYGRTTVLEAVKAGGWKNFFDGTLASVPFPSWSIATWAFVWQVFLALPRQHGWWRDCPLLCWSCRQATLVHGPNATLVGTDEFGNKYYERLTEQYGTLSDSHSCSKQGTHWTHVCGLWLPEDVLRTAVGRHRWVIFGDLNWPSGQEPSTVPPSWHGWLHCTVDKRPSQVTTCSCS